MSTNYISKDFPGYLLNIEEFTPVEAIEVVGSTMNAVFIHNETGRKFHVRFPPIESSYDVVKAQRQYMSEVWMSMRVRHPCIQLFKGFSLLRDCENERTQFTSGLFFDYHGNLTLQDLIDAEIRGEAPSGWTPTKKSCVIFGITAAINYLHSMRVMHRNLKTTKILIDENFEPVLSDLSDAIVLQPDEMCADYNVGTMLWRSPEMAKREPYDFSSDIFAYGQIIMTILTLKLPFKDGTDVATALSTWDDNVVDNNDIPEIFNDGYIELYTNACSLSNRSPITAFYQYLTVNDDVFWPGTNVKEYLAYRNRIIEHDKAYEKELEEIMKGNDEEEENAE
ncbi:hypothetical protein TRFO_05134 [Tritrichomonas foetus]|uniref:Protein kinase domain-containing protein n=1 Tax=Tritrichomonas foetus TaxID=1144522 RepID=A0A1J4KCY8_9EUKA|nr:hypothetical protein TRFO_05134 [Tritrichomonas foetus]|eukprot:OHT07518.1 hypothetical protein TRFO_05134 [Tritrichomonas foetus]